MAVMPTFNTGKLIGASEWNAHADQINTNTNAIATNTSGLASGTARITALETPRTAILKKNADQSVPAGADTLITWQVETHDPANMASSNRITINQTGVYLVVAQLNVQPQAATTATQRVMYVRRNGGFVGDTSVAVLAQPGVSGGTNQTGAGNGMMTGTVMPLTSGDYLEVLLWHDAATALNVRPNSFGGSSFAVTRLF